MKAVLIYSAIAFVTTFSGSLLPVYNEAWTGRHLWRLLAFSSGVLLGIAHLHLLPEGFEMGGRMAGIAVLATFVTLFAAENVTMVHACEDFLHPPTSTVVPASALVALTIHAGVDGMAIGVGLNQNIVLGSIISLGVILHKFSDGLTLTSLLRAAGYSRRRQWTLGLLLALATPAGALISFFSAGPLEVRTIGVVLGIAAGSFLYVGAADLLPRLHNAHDRYALLFFIVGIIAVGSF